MAVIKVDSDVSGSGVVIGEEVVSGIAMGVVEVSSSSELV